jgi:hypothetical protein
MKANPPMNSIQQKSTELLSTFGSQYGLSGANMLQALKSTYFRAAKGEEPLTDGELMGACAVCKKYGLDPFLREIFCTRAAGRLLLMVSIDGWLKQALTNKDYDGMESPKFEYDESGKLLSCETVIHRKDQQFATSYVAFYQEWAKNTPPWNQQPRHMLYIKSLKNCIRLAFGISGIDVDDPQDITDVQMTPAPRRQTLPQPVEPVSTAEDDPFNGETQQREPGED